MASARTKPKSNPEPFKIDEAACLKGGEFAGQYLDLLGKTDLASLTQAEWSMFCMKLVSFTLMHAIQPPLDDMIPF